MTNPIWQKNTLLNIDETMMNFMAGEDIELDKQLITYDIQASKAHVKGLNSIRVLSDSETDSLLDRLRLLQSEIDEGKFVLDNRFEDGHSAIEFYLVAKLGELGKKIHTGRSRNDQVLVASRLYLKDKLLEAITYVDQAIKTALKKAEASMHHPMPGYTHMQRAVPSSCGLWFGCFAEAMIDNLEALQQTLKLIDANPLGTAAGYGVNLPLNRYLTTKELGFNRIQINPVYTQNSRGKYELNVLFVLSQCLLDIRRYCWDLSVFTTQEFDFVVLPEEMTTGSSIMPNKNNPDLVELMRASYPSIQAAIIELQSLLSLPSGYQRDLQFTKGPLIRAVQKSLQTLALFPKLIEGTRFKTKQLLKAIDAPMHATDLAVELSSEGMAFRDAYKEVVDRYEELEKRSAVSSLKQRVSFGGCDNPGFDEMKKRFKDLTVINK